MNEHSNHPHHGSEAPALAFVNRSVNSLGVVLLVAVAADVRTFDLLAKKEGAALENAISNTLYRSTLAEFRDEFLTLVAAETGIERKTKATGKTRKVESTDGEGKTITVDEPIFVYDETEAEYFDRVCAELNREPSSFQSLADRLSVNGDKEIKFDPSSRERKPAGPKSTPKRFLEAAQRVIDGGKRDAWIAKYGGDGSVEVIGAKMKELEDAEKAAQKLDEKWV